MRARPFSLIRSVWRWLGAAAARLLTALVVLALAVPSAAAQTGDQPPRGGNGELPTAGPVRLYIPLLATPGQPPSPDGLWQSVDEAALAPVQAQRQIVPQKYHLAALDQALLRRVMAAAPLEGSAAAASGANTIALPMPDGTEQRFTLYESPIMEKGLADQFPEIRTFAGRGLTDPSATVRLDWTPRGFHALILSAAGTVYIDPYSTADVNNYLSYYAADFTSDKIRGPEAVEFAEAVRQADQRQARVSPLASGSQLRTYRLAVAASGEYTQFQGGTVPLALAAIVTSINRVDGIYEREVAVRLTLVANNNLIIYTNAGTDPYSNGDDRGANQTNLDLVIGNGNYDIGHIFNTGGGGVATLGCVCNNAIKARGVTGSSAPVGDPFDVDYVAHEMGHQLNAQHTWNGTQGSCTNDQYSSGTAFEPGSGSTIMAYAGICGSDDLQSNSDPYFHSISIDEIVAFTTSGGGSTCGTVAASGNGIPAANAGPDYTIPANTPFALTGSGSDPNGDALTYTWEEFDTAPAGPPDNPNRAPFFRSYSPSASPSRTLPRLVDLINNTTAVGEVLPAVGGTLNFRLTVRDNRLGGGGVNADAMQVIVAGSAGPFAVTAPNAAGTWGVGTAQTVTWNVANTTAAPVSCATVNLLLSLDGGFTYPVTLAAGVPNSGSAAITVPNNPTALARVKVACATNIFFDISNANFTIKPTANAGGPYTTSEGTDVLLNASLSSPGDTYAWDFNNDGIFGEAVGVNPVFDRVGQDGVFPVAVRVTKNGISDVAGSTVTVNNVAPSVTLAPAGPQAEGAPLAVNGIISDPGWLEALTGTIDWGDGTPPEALAGTLENLRPDATLTFAAAHAYGDNGSFTVQVCGSDDDTTVCRSQVVEVTNADPTAAIDEAGTYLINGVPTFLLVVGQDQAFAGRVQDPGSDDLIVSWDWDAEDLIFPNHSRLYLVNPPNPDPLPSPSVQPRDLTDGRTTPFAFVCRFIVTQQAVDDDGGLGQDQTYVVVVGRATRPRTASYWKNLYQIHTVNPPDGTITSYLQVVDHMSRVFAEARDASTPELALALLSAGGAASARDRLDRELLTAWLNFGSGSLSYAELVDTNGDHVADTAFASVMAAAEAVRLNPAATTAALEAQIHILQLVNQG